MSGCIDSYLEEATRRPWIYGGGPGGFRGHDCSLFFANYFRSVFGFDPAKDFRGSYASREEAEAIVARAGGLVPLIAGPMAAAGCRAASDPRDGDGAVISIRAGGVRFEMPALRRGRRWIVADPRRLHAIDGHCMLAWRAH